MDRKPLNLIFSVFSLRRCYAVIAVIYFFVNLQCIEQGYSQQASQNDDKPDCNYNIHMEWSKECGSGVIAASPLIADLDADGKLDIITASFTEEISVTSGSTGQVPEQTHWPFRFPGATFHASPLLYDIDQDGHDDLLLTTSDGQIHFLNSKGYQLLEKSIKIGNVVVRKNWFDSEISMDPRNIEEALYKKQVDQSDFGRHKQADDRVIILRSGAVYNGNYVSIDAHVLATPVIADLNNDGRREELILPVTYFFDKQTYRLPENEVKKNDFNDVTIENYLVSGIVVLNLTTQDIVFDKALELTKVLAEYPAYQLFTPTVIDLDGNSGPLEIVLCTSAGHLIVLDSNGVLRPGFPKTFGTIHGQITVEDLDGNVGLELIVVDSSGNVMCLNDAGVVLWEADMPSTSTAGSRVVDLNADGILDVVIASDDGSVWAFRGDTGQVITGWPHQLGGRITSNVLITNLKPHATNVDIVVLGYDGRLYILTSSGQCVQVTELGEHSLVQVLSANLVDNTAALELVIATMDGTILCLAVSDLDAVTQPFVMDWRHETPTLNQFTFWNNQFQVIVEDDFKEVTGATFDMVVTIVDNRPQQYRWKTYYITVYAGIYILQDKTKFDSPGSYRLTFTCPPHPLHTVLTVRLTNEFAQEIATTFTARFNMQWQHDVKWLLILPTVSLLLLLLLVFGFPEADLLPMVHSTKDS